MRGLLERSPTPHPLGATLPILFQGDSFVQRMCAALDEVLAPVIITLDSFPAYLDPATTPEDLLEWLGGWVGLVLDGAQTVERQRMLVHLGAALHQWRGTTYGIEQTINALYGVTPEIVENGGADFGESPETDLPGSPVAELIVRVRVPDVDQLDRRQLEAVIDSLKPAHVPHRLEVLPAPDPAKTDRPAAAADEIDSVAADAAEPAPDEADATDAADDVDDQPQDRAEQTTGDDGQD